MPTDFALSLEDRLKIDSICDAYEAHLREGVAPPLEDLLASYPDPFREHLRQALSAVERAYRTERVGAASTTLAYESNYVPVETLPQIPGYEILEKLGEGGMGVVYKAREIHPPRLVALKMLRDFLQPNLQARRRFRFEAEAIAALDHPGIVPIYTVGDVQGPSYLCLKYLDNGSLAEQLKKRTYTSHESAEILLQISLAIQHAHDRGVLHRDLKPGNILLDSSDRLYVADFGLARRLQAEEPLSQSGAVMGTFAYMAPEQASDPRAVTVRTDVYALGAILYRMLTGVAPNPGHETTDQLAWLLGNQNLVRPRTLNPAVPSDLEHICLRCLERSPANRYASAAELAADLQRFLNGEPIVVQTEGIVDWIVQIYRTKTGQAEGSYIRSTIAYGAIRMVLHLAIAGVVVWGSRLWVVLIILGLDFLAQGVILGAMLQRQFRQTRLADRYSIVVGSGSLLAQILLILTLIPLHPMGPSRDILAFYPPMLIVGGLCGFIMGATSWGVLFPLGILGMLLTPIVPFCPISGPILFALFAGGGLILWGLAKARESKPRSTIA